jgi:streptogramin lyase
VVTLQIHAGYKIGSLSSSVLSQTPATNVITEFPLPSNQSLAYPLGLATDSKGNVWFGEGNTDNIVEFILSNQTFRTFHIPVPSGEFAWIWTPVFDSSGNLWFSTTNGSLIWRLNTTDGEFQSFTTGNSNVQPYTLAYNPETNQLWFTSFASDQFGVFQISGQSATIENVYQLPITGSLKFGSLGAADIALDDQGNVYVTESYVGEIAKFSQSTGQLEHVWQLPNGSQPLGIAIDPRTNDLWFTNHATSDFGYINQTSNRVFQFSTSAFYYNGYPEVTLPYWISISSSGMVWFNEHVGDRIARFDPNTMQLTEFQVPTPSSEPIKLALDNSKGLVWFSEFSGNKIGMIEQNQSLSPEIELSQSSYTLAGNSVTISANVSSSVAFPLNVSSSANKLGVLGSNFSVSTTDSGTLAQITISRGGQLSSGTYYMTICGNSAGPAKSCAIATIIVEPGANIYVAFVIAVVVVAFALGISIYFVRKWQHRARLGEKSTPPSSNNARTALPL